MIECVGGRGRGGARNSFNGLTSWKHWHSRLPVPHHSRPLRPLPLVPGRLRHPQCRSFAGCADDLLKALALTLACPRATPQTALAPAAGSWTMAWTRTATPSRTI